MNIERLIRMMMSRINSVTLDAYKIFEFFFNGCASVCVQGNICTSEIKWMAMFVIIRGHINYCCWWRIGLVLVTHTWFWTINTFSLKEPYIIKSNTPSPAGWMTLVTQNSNSSLTLSSSLSWRIEPCVYVCVCWC